MKLSATRDVLLKPLQAVIGVVERRQTMPILSNVLLVAKDNELSVTATDLEVELVAQADVAVETGGEVTVSGRKLLDICRALPEGSLIAISMSGEKVFVRSGRSKFTLATLPAAEFPSVEDIKAGQTLKVTADRKNAFFDGTTGCTLLPEWNAAGDWW
jgi:DNA polymerase-3 subunit beta